MVRNLSAVKQLSASLDGLQASIATFEEGLSRFLLTDGFPMHREEVEAARGGLEDLGLYEAVKDAIDRSELLVRQGQYEEAEMLVLEANRKLSEASGANDDLRSLGRSGST